MLGTFTYTYDGAITARLATVDLPQQPDEHLQLPGDSGDHRLQTIHHKYPNTSTLSKYDYTYDEVGNILTWRQQADTTARRCGLYGYDAANQLMRAVHQTTDGIADDPQRYGYGTIRRETGPTSRSTMRSRGSTTIA